MAKSTHLKFNDLAPDLELLDADGKPARLSALWKKQAVVLAFARHFGCPQCKEMVTTLAHASKDMEANGLLPVVVTQGTSKEAKAFCRKYARGVMCLSDSERRAYRAFGLERANLFQTFLSPRVWASNARLKSEKGWRSEFPPKGQDAMQMAGMFVIGTDGRIRLPYYYDDIADHPPMDLLLHGVMGVNWKKPFEKPVIPARLQSKSRSK
ncbi:MAG TPA: peroxiredoxin-like family protein [Anaerolineales bacterium]